MHPKLPDPADSIICQHLHTVWKIYHAFAESAQHLFWSSWNIALGALLKVRYRWQVVSGPLQALQAYLLDYEFDIHDGKQWKRTGYGGIPDCILSLEDCWPVLLQKLTEEFKWQRLLRLTRYARCGAWALVLLPLQSAAARCRSPCALWSLVLVPLQGAAACVYPFALWSLDAGAAADCRCQMLMAVRDLECGCSCYGAHKYILLSGVYAGILQT